MKQNSAFCRRHGRRATWEGQGENYASFSMVLALSKLPVQSMVNKTGEVIHPSPSRLGFETDNGLDYVNSVAKCGFCF